MLEPRILKEAGYVFDELPTQSPEEILSDNGSPYVTWRGKSAFTRELDTYRSEPVRRTRLPLD